MGLELDHTKGITDLYTGEKYRENLLDKARNLTEAECHALLLILNLLDANIIFFTPQQGDCIN